jgi:hypothetical protein|tara:strand:+ start:86 stop:619 length:534 start_codon:yes stop_codon:yes gene_type:complete
MHIKLSKSWKKVNDPTPTCSTKRCKNPCAPVEHFYTKNKVRTHTRWRRICNPCHQRITAGAHGLTRITQVVAKNAGFDNENEYLNSKHPYRRFRKDYCENIDSRLGFKCNTKLPTKKMLKEAGITTLKPHSFLEVDHINGDPTDNREENTQTLCHPCHMIKGIQEGDSQTPGRTKLR